MSLASLRSAQPLAWRMLGRVRVRCPVATSGSCAWVGPYSEVHAHLLASDAHRGVAPARASSPSGPVDAAALARAEADALREAGNEKLAARQFGDAVRLYSKGLASCPSAQLFANRAAAWLAAGAPAEAAADCRAALALQPDYARASARLGRALMELGDAEGAVAQLEASVSRAPSPSAELSEALDRARHLRALLAASAAASAAGALDGAAALAGEAASLTGAPSVALALVRAELARGAPDRAQRVALRLLRADPRCAEAHALRASAQLQDGDFEGAATSAREALRLAPDDAAAADAFRRARRAGAAAAAARSAAFGRAFEAAEPLFGEALAAAALPAGAPLRASLLAERAAVRLRLKDAVGALGDCDAALDGRDDCKAAFVQRCAALRALGRHRDALASIRRAVELDPADGVLQKHAEAAEFEARRVERPDYYELLGCGKTAGPNDVKAAFKRRAMAVHPDRLGADATPEARAEAEATFKAVGEARARLGGACAWGVRARVEPFWRHVTRLPHLPPQRTTAGAGGAERPDEKGPLRRGLR